MDGFELTIHGTGYPLPAGMTGLRKFNKVELVTIDYVWAWWTKPIKPDKQVISKPTLRLTRLIN
jgi:hypothetical protein